MTASALGLLLFGFTIRLGDVQVATPRVELSQIAGIEEANRETRAKLETVEVARSLTPGSSRTLTIETLRMRLLAEGFRNEEIRFAGPSSATVTRQGQTIAPEMVLARVEERIRAGAGPGDLVEVGRLPARLPLFPLGVVEIVVETPENLAEGANAWVTITAGEASHRFPVSYRLRRMRPLAVAARRIERGEAFDPSMIRFEVREVGQIRSPILTLEEIVGFSAKQPILAGTPLSTGFIERPPLVRAGQAVVIIARSAGVVVRITGEARQAGGPGEVVRVLTETGRLIPGRVTGRGEVTVLD